MQPGSVVEVVEGASVVVVVCDAGTVVLVLLR
jgi:hypothetical protein